MFDIAADLRRFLSGNPDNVSVTSLASDALDEIESLRVAVQVSKAKIRELESSIDVLKCERAGLQESNANLRADLRDLRPQTVLA